MLSGGFEWDELERWKQGGGEAQEHETSSGLLLRCKSKAVACLPPHCLINTHDHKIFFITPHRRDLAKGDIAKQVSY